MAKFKNIDYGNMLFETMRSYFALSTRGAVSIFYKFLFAFTSVLQTSFNLFSTWRAEKWMIANCKWQIGQLTNVLNYFFDPTNKTIYIDQVTLLDVFDPVMTGNQATNFDPIVTGFESTLYEPTFDQTVIITGVIIHVPAAYATPGTANYTNLVSVIEQIKITGIPYTIVSL